ncbi:hypothetical protein ADICEAN_03257 [Cesiribacter andamanensis AMV16]|uniref:Uncharacterized protein n=1 Tax=Cesiribacter andamanensis AMV16 TaxID=1279009 RepID=M7NSY6_9BACT|nr:hypothetical protein ADICEAN_03257 [Cesiribacter andamanensis AMV16]
MICIQHIKKKSQYVKKGSQFVNQEAMNFILLDNSNTLFSSYLKGWERALKIYEEEADFVGKKFRNRHKRHKKA